MTRLKAWPAGVGVLLLVSAAIALALTSLVPNNQELARRAEAALGDALGVPVTLGDLHWRLLPLPVLVVERAATVQPQPIRLERLTLYLGMPRWSDDWHNWAGRIRIARAEVDGGELPQLSLRGLGQADSDEGSGEPAEAGFAGTPLARLVFRDVTWISRHGLAVSYEGEIDFDSGWRPRIAQFRRPGVQPAAALQLARRGAQDRWDAHIELANGSAVGQIELLPRPGGQFRLEGQLQLRRIDAAGAMSAFNRQPMLAGVASGSTALWADGASAGELARALQTRSTLSFSQARLLGFDLDKAMRNIGRDTEGHTALAQLTGQLETRSTEQGTAIDFTGVKAESETMTLSGHMRLSPARRVDAQFEVDLPAGLGGLPLQITGPFENVKVSLPRAVLAGAAFGATVPLGLGPAPGANSGVGRFSGNSAPLQ